MVVAQATPLWSLVWGKPQVDPADLARAVSEEARKPELDHRTRCLIRAGPVALRDYWGSAAFDQRLGQFSERPRLRDLLEESNLEDGFPSLRERLMDKTDPEVVREFLRDLGTRIGARKPIALTIGGAIALILTGPLARSTEDIDVVDEVPAEIRKESELLDELRSRYGLRLTHFQSHDLPPGWNDRIGFPQDFGNISVRLVDPLDVFLGKLTSTRPKDLDDLRILKGGLDRDLLNDRLRRTRDRLLADDDLHAQATKNWYILFGEELPS